MSPRYHTRSTVGVNRNCDPDVKQISEEECKSEMSDEDNDFFFTPNKTKENQCTGTQF